MVKKSKEKFKKQLEKNKNNLDKMSEIRLIEYPLFSFKYFDFYQSEKNSKISQKLYKTIFDKLKHYSNEKIPNSFTGNFKEYGLIDEIPNKVFEIPKNIDKEAQWGSIRLQNKERLIFCRPDTKLNIFYIVFIDTEHKFWPTEKKNT